MLKNEIAELLNIIAVAYPNTKIKNPEYMLKAWEMAFGEDEADIIYKAARYHMDTSPYFPTIADIRKAVNKGQMIYGESQQKAIEAPVAPNKVIPVDTTSFCELCGLCDIRDQRFCPCDF